MSCCANIMEPVEKPNLEAAKTVEIIFNTMEYGVIEYELADAVAFTQKHLPKSSDHVPVDHIIKKLATPNTKPIPSALERMIILNQIALKIHGQSELLCQLNYAQNKILIKDTMAKDIPLMIDYFKYYSNLAALSDKLYEDWKPYDDLLCIKSRNAQLCTLAMVTAPAIAAGCRVNVFIEREEVPLLQLFKQICTNAGLAKEYFDFAILENINSLEKMQYLHKTLPYKYPYRICYFGDVTTGRQLREITAGFPISLTMLFNGKTSLLLFDDGDLDSACEAVVEGAWSHTGQLPWAINTVIVQETVAKTFVKKLAQRLKKIKVDLLKDKLTDVGKQDIRLANKVKDYVDKAKELGFEVYEANSSDENLDVPIFFVPTVIVGNFVESNCVLTDPEELPVVTVVTFRTAKEAVALANNTRFGLATSVWCENGSLVNEIVPQLNFGVVWVNTFGEIKAQAALCPHKQSGLGYFGGEEAFFINMKHKGLESADEQSNKCVLIPVTKGLYIPTTKNSKLARDLVDFSSKVLPGWAKSASKRNQHLLEALLKIHMLKGKPAEEIKLWSELLMEYSARCKVSKSHVAYDNNLLVTVYEPRGVIIIDCKDTLTSGRLIIGAVAYGNIVIVVTDNPSLLNEVSKMLPKGVLTVTQERSNEFIQCLIKHQEVNAYWLEPQVQSLIAEVEGLSKHNLKRTFIYKSTTNISHEVVSLQSRNAKCIWSTSGCTLV